MFVANRLAISVLVVVVVIVVVVLAAVVLVVVLVVELLVLVEIVYFQRKGRISWNFVFFLIFIEYLIFVKTSKALHKNRPVCIYDNTSLNSS